MRREWRRPFNLFSNNLAKFTSIKGIIYNALKYFGCTICKHYVHDALKIGKWYKMECNIHTTKFTIENTSNVFFVKKYIYCMLLQDGQYPSVLSMLDNSESYTVVKRFFEVMTPISILLMIPNMLLSLCQYYLRFYPSFCPICLSLWIDIYVIQR